MSRLRPGRRGREHVQIGAPDPTLTGSAGLLAVVELAGKVRLAESLDAVIDKFKVRRRGCSAGEFLIALACAQLAGADHLVGLDHRRADRVSTAFWAQETPASSTVTGLARQDKTAPKFPDLLKRDFTGARRTPSGSAT